MIICSTIRILRGFVKGSFKNARWGGSESVLLGEFNHLDKALDIQDIHRSHELNA